MRQQFMSAHKLVLVTHGLMRTCPIGKIFPPECRYAECRYAECRYAECRYAECRYAECRGAIKTVQYIQN